MARNPRKTKAQLDGRHRRPDRPVHSEGREEAYIRSDNGPVFIAEAVRDWIKAVGAKNGYIEPGSPWENRYCKGFSGRMRDELLNGEIFYSLREAQIIIER